MSRPIVTLRTDFGSRDGDVRHTMWRPATSIWRRRRRRAREARIGSAASEPTWSGGALRGRVVHVDRFGNLVTNARGATGAAHGAEVEVALVGSTGRGAVGRVLPFRAPREPA